MSKGKFEGNEFRKRLVQCYAQRRSELKKAQNPQNSVEQNFVLAHKLARLPRNSSATRVRLRCAETYRPRGVFRFFGLSRIVIRHLRGVGRAPGLKGSSW